MVKEAVAGLCVVLVGLVLGSRGSLVGQEDGRCGLDLRAGVAVPSAEVPAGPRGNITFGVGPGGGVGVLCPVSGRFLVGGDWEIETIQRVGFLRLLGSGAFWFPLGAAGSPSVLLKLSSGWTLSQRLGTSLPIIEPGQHTDLDDWGFTVGAGLRLSGLGSEKVRPFVDGGWRVVWLNTGPFNEEGRIVGESLKAVSTFPFAVGLKFRL